jgi:hypothetical protein
MDADCNATNLCTYNQCSHNGQFCFSNAECNENANRCSNTGLSCSMDADCTVVKPAVVYIGRPKSPSDFVGANGTLATKEFQVIKVMKNGVFQEFRGGSKFVVTGSVLEVITPDSAVWDGATSLYPFIFTSDSDWTVDVCVQVPSGYTVVGYYDADGNIVSSDCSQIVVTGETKVVVFKASDIGSPEPSMNVTLTTSHKGKKTTHKMKVSDLRKQTFETRMSKHVKAGRVVSDKFLRNLALGSRGQYVRSLQKFLNKNGFVVAKSGAGSVGRETTYFGARTSQALAKFQQARLKETHLDGLRLGTLTDALRSYLNDRSVVKR